MVGGVDIGTEWNLKVVFINVLDPQKQVDIGTEWNLKVRDGAGRCGILPVDIGTEWNLKYTLRRFEKTQIIRRYRNRVEFKGHVVLDGINSVTGRYRNRVEFKVSS